MPHGEKRSELLTGSSSQTVRRRIDNAHAQANPGDQVRERRIDASETLTLRKLTGRRSSDDDDVLICLQIPLSPCKRLSQQALDLVALHCSSDLARHRQAQTRLLGRSIRERVEHEMAVRNRATLPIHPLELRAAR